MSNPQFSKDSLKFLVNSTLKKHGVSSNNVKKLSNAERQQILSMVRDLKQNVETIVKNANKQQNAAKQQNNTKK
ncbi:hypothetical protein [Bacillus sp. CGMCC 1.16541]|uniref:hypothetical protein n=1 Tax=Bacillus sp. CGMCC 1.16541 TaxID=2185143 RepID=UPI000D738BCD|nr:hypothetical protein [Bacillus sp. CGMCC 1.16541]